jgi:hypothetical protein
MTFEKGVWQRLRAIEREIEVFEGLNNDEREVKMTGNCGNDSRPSKNIKMGSKRE